MTRTNADRFIEAADTMGFPRRSLEQVQSALREAKINNADAALARLMLRHGRLTVYARAWVQREYPQTD